MAIITVRQRRSFQFEESKAQKGSIQRTGSAELLVVCDSAPDFGEIANDTNTWPEFFGRKIPQINDLETVGGIEFYVTRRRFAYYEEDQNAVLLTVGYDSKAEEDPEDGSGEPQEGESETWKRCTVTSEMTTQPARDYGNLNQFDPGIQPRNSAGDPFDGLTSDRPRVRITYTNTKVQDPSFTDLLSYVGSVNLARYRGCEYYTLLCTGFSAEFDDKNQLWVVSVDLLHDPEGFWMTLYDVGFNEIVDGQRRAITDTLGNPVSKPVALDGNGKAVPISSIVLGEPSASNPGGGLVEKRIYPYPQMPFGALIQVCRI